MKPIAMILSDTSSVPENQGKEGNHRLGSDLVTGWNLNLVNTKVKGWSLGSET
jgi:hypothetical protein